MNKTRTKIVAGMATTIILSLVGASAYAASRGPQGGQEHRASLGRQERAGCCREEESRQAKRPLLSLLRQDVDG